MLCPERKGGGGKKENKRGLTHRATGKEGWKEGGGRAYLLVYLWFELKCKFCLPHLPTCTAVVPVAIT